jgi:hypothetical protein
MLATRFQESTKFSVMKIAKSLSACLIFSSAQRLIAQQPQLISLKDHTELVRKAGAAQVTVPLALSMEREWFPRPGGKESIRPKCEDTVLCQREKLSSFEPGIPRDCLNA